MTAEEIRKARLAAKAAAMGGSSTASDNSNKTTTATTPAGGTTDAALQNALDASDAQLNYSYDQQAKNLQKYYDTAKQNANNDALSRGMARSSYVSDRLSGLDSDRAQGLSDLDTQKANAIASARAELTQSYEDKAASALADEKKEYAGNIMAYYSDYQKEINALQGDGDSSNDWKIPYLQAARQQKMLDLGLTEATVNGGTTGTTGTQIYTPLPSPIKDDEGDEGDKPVLVTSASQLSKAAQGLLTDITKYATSYTDRLNRIQNQANSLSEAEVTFLLKYFGLS